MVSKKVLAIVGASGSKLNELQKRTAVQLVAGILDNYDPRYWVFTSGRSPEGGIDIFAEVEADRRGFENRVCPPAEEHNHWQCKDADCYGYKARNLDVAHKADAMYSIVTSTHFLNLCKHCKIRGHDSSGACFTARYARRIGKIVWFMAIDEMGYMYQFE